MLSLCLGLSAVSLPVTARAAAPLPVAAWGSAHLEEKAAVLGLDGADEGSAKNLTVQLRRAFERRGWGGSEELSLAEVRLTMGCQGDDAACLAEAGASLGVEMLIYGELAPDAGGNYVLTLHILDVPSATEDTTTSLPVTRDQLQPANIEATAAEIVESLFPQDEAPIEPTIDTVEGEDPQPQPEIEHRDQPPKSGLIWGPYRPRPTWKWAGFGVGIGLLVVGVAGAAVTGTLLENKLRDDVFDRAEESLTDCVDPEDPTRAVPCEGSADALNLANDVDPNMRGDLCAAASANTNALGDSLGPGEVRNKRVNDACSTAAAVEKANVASFAVIGVGAVLTLVFTTLLFVHKDTAATRAMRRRDVRLGAAPNQQGGFSFSGGFRF